MFHFEQLTNSQKLQELRKVPLTECQLRGERIATISFPAVKKKKNQVLSCSCLKIVYSVATRPNWGFSTREFCTVLKGHLVILSDLYI